MQIPSVPWQVTGNHWLSLPCINPADGAVHAIGVLHRGARAAIEFAGAEHFETGAGTPLFGPVLRVNGEVRALAAEGIAWERAVGWLPTFTCTVGTLLLRGTVFAPYGRDADMAGAVYTLGVENRGTAEAIIEIAMEGSLGHRQQRVRSARPFDDEHRVSIGADDVLLLEGTAIPGLAALAIGADGPARLEAPDRASRNACAFAIRRDLVVAPGATVQCAFYITVGPVRDGAQATIALGDRARRPKARRARRWPGEHAHRRAARRGPARVGRTEDDRGRAAEEERAKSGNVVGNCVRPN